MKNWVQQAREASGLSLDDCASALFLSRDAFAQKDANPGTTFSTKTLARSSKKHFSKSIFSIH